uniref:Prephenate dehydratase n=1 Tax=Paulinella micropora TaxID=1928728 RepID=A0A385I0M8_9EUKA|nr:Prephenate dehydratase [Paulinella micropora]AXY63476.1 Prephenate dehydratase [Paulinella micropora]
MVMRIAFLGPIGTYGEQAAHELVLEESEAIELVPQKGISAVVEALVNDSCTAAVVPVENSVEGGVTASLDALWQHPDLCIRRALIMPIRHALLSNGSLGDISEVLSHPQALAQCNQWLIRHLPNVLQLPTHSTAEAASMVAGSNFRAAIASKQAAKDHRLNELAYPINDIAGNCTRFLLLDKGERNWSGPTASMAFSLQSNVPGALLKALACFARRGLNMSRIESRPSKREMGEYIFFVDLDLSKADRLAISQVVQDLLPLCNNLTMFGAYFTKDLS